ncbi:sulfur-carrier protein [Methylomarinovum caldicuralii]|uniref:Sulfur-carrier protein n=1 Tax=Methylomarinovum caldicuralii TaxID=438856 RepID=A0AAU9C7J3_9GAMM|nr:MoaD/ThiS family protein [Methylomarinovum caldicuralii]BCX81366.1 sulfur-carrier protein [Methylomarinovum caldicuralii]
MAIRVRVFASLKERLGIEQTEMTPEGIGCVADVWRRLTGDDLPAQVLAAVNMNHAGPDAPVRDGDEVAFFPPVTGG